MAELQRIKQIQLSDGAHEIDAKYWNGHEFSELKNIAFLVCSKASDTPAGVKFTPKGGSTEITGTLAASAADTQKIYLVYSPNVAATGITDNYDEYIAVNNEWERIGGTGEIDLSNYAKKASITLSGTAASAGAATITSGSAGAQTATGSATVTYKKSATATGSAGAATITSGSAGAATVNGSNFSFTGTAATIAGNVSGTSVADIEYTPAGTINKLTQAAHSHTVNLAKSTVTYATGAVTSVSSNGSHSHTVDTHKHGDNVSASKITAFTGGSVNFGTFSGGSAATCTYAAAGTANALTSATVSGTGVLSFNSGTFNTDATKVTAFNGGSAASWTGATYTAATITYSGVTAAGAPSAETITSSSDGSHAHTVTLTTSTFNNVTGATLGTAGAIDYTPTFTGTEATLTHEVTQGSVSIAYTPAGTIGGSQSISSHTHSVNVADHTHSITLSDTTITGTASVAVSSHTHSVDVANHTHSVSVSGNNYTA